MTTEQKSSPLPWKLYGLPNDGDIEVGSEKNSVTVFRQGSITPEDASLIVLRVNQGPVFDAMLHALKIAAEYTNIEEQDAKIIRAALKLAKEVSK